MPGGEDPVQAKLLHTKGVTTLNDPSFFSRKVLPQLLLQVMLVVNRGDKTKKLLSRGISVYWGAIRLNGRRRFNQIPTEHDRASTVAKESILLSS